MWVQVHEYTKGWSRPFAYSADNWLFCLPPPYTKNPLGNLHGRLHHRHLRQILTFSQSQRWRKRRAINRRDLLPSTREITNDRCLQSLRRFAPVFNLIISASYAATATTTVTALPCARGCNNCQRITVLAAETKPRRRRRLLLYHYHDGFNNKPVPFGS